MSTLVLLPGLLCDAAVWAPQVAALSGRIECHVPHYGELDSLGAMAEHVLVTAPAQRFALAGHSMGGRVAFEVWRRAPERVERLALLDTSYHPLADGEAGETERRGRHALLETARVPGDVVVDEVGTVRLEVHTLAGGVGGHQDPHGMLVGTCVEVGLQLPAPGLALGERSASARAGATRRPRETSASTA